MDADVRALLVATFSENEWPHAAALVEEIEHRHVMAESDYNLKNARMSCLKLADGDLKELEHMIAAAKIDFRDVIMWAGRRKSDK